MMKDEQTLREQKVTEGCKMMVVGSTLNDVMTVMPPSASVDREDTKPHKCERKESCVFCDHSVCVCFFYGPVLCSVIFFVYLLYLCMFTRT